MADFTFRSCQKIAHFRQQHRCDIRRESCLHRKRIAIAGFEHIVRRHIIVVIFVIAAVGALGAVFFIVWVADYKVVHRRVRRKKFLGAVFAYTRGHFGAIDFVFPGVRQGLVHVGGDRETVGRCPRLRPVFQKRKFERQMILVLLDEFVHPARIGFEQHALFAGQRRRIALRRAGESQGAKFLVDGNHRRPEDFRQLAARHAPQQVHLPQAVLRHDVALRLDHVFSGTGADVRDAPAVAIHAHFAVQAIYGDGSVHLRQRPVSEPPDARARGNDQNYE